MEGQGAALYGMAQTAADLSHGCPTTIGLVEVGCGLVYTLIPRDGVDSYTYQEVVLHAFDPPPDAAVPGGNLALVTLSGGTVAFIGATVTGGAYGHGAIFEVVP